MRLFGGFSRTEDELFKIITDSVRFRIMGLKLRITPDVIKAAEVWNFPIDKFHKYQCILEEMLNDNMDIDAEDK